MIKFISMAALLLMVAPVLAEDRAAARQAFIEASKYYDLNQYAEALEAFKRAYWNHEDPVILYNIAQCQRALKHKAEAIEAYRSYLRKAVDPPNREEVRSIVVELEGALERERSLSVAPPEGTLGRSTQPVVVAPPAAPSDSPPIVVAPAAPAEPAAVATPEVVAKPAKKRTWIWGVVVGVAVVVVGVAVGVGVGFGAQPRAPRADNSVSF